MPAALELWNRQVRTVKYHAPRPRSPVGRYRLDGQLRLDIRGPARGGHDAPVRVAMPPTDRLDPRSLCPYPCGASHTVLLSHQTVMPVHSFECRLSPRVVLAGTALLLPVWLTMIAPARVMATESQTALIDRYGHEVRPLLKTLCFDCHGGEAQEAGVRLDTLAADIDHPDFKASVWHDALDQIKQGSMPPEEAASLSDEQRQTLVQWISKVLRLAEQSKRFADGRVLMRRLTRYEYNNTLGDLLGVALDVAKELPPEPASPDGFLNDGATLEMSSTQIEAYLAAARRALDVAIVEGQRPQGFRYYATETAVGRLPRRREGGHIPVNPEFLVDIPEFPRRGPFRMLVRASAVIPEGDAVPRLRVSLGNVPGIIHVPRKIVGEVDVAAPAARPQTYEFRGRLEDYPQPGEREFGGNVDFNGLVGLIDFIDADGKELRYRDRDYSDPPGQKDAKKNRRFRGAAGRQPPDRGPRYNLVIKSVEFEAPYYPQWPPPSHRRLMGHSSQAESEPARVREILGRFVPRAYRRPAEPREIDRLVEMFQQIRPQMPSYEAAVRETLAAVLVSPHFLYMVEERRENPTGTADQRDADASGTSSLTETADPTGMPLRPFELATRLSYFLWSTMPDERLRTLAASGQLSDREVLRGETRRMMDDPRSVEFVHHFADQWFDLDALERIAVNPEFYPDFDEDLKAAMRAESRGVLQDILHRDASCRELLDSDWTVVNRQLARHYGLQSLPRSSTPQRVSLEAGDRRGGVLTQAAFLLSRSDGERPHPIRRAVWILDRLLDSPPASPPPEVPTLDSESPDLAGRSLKEQLEIHRDRDSCRSCHAGIDPWGIPLEHFDAVGRWQRFSPTRQAGAKNKAPSNKGGKQTAAEQESAGPPVDASSVLPDGTGIAGVDELKQHLVAEHRAAFARSIVKRLASYALGRSLDLGDRAAIESLTKEFLANDLRLRSLVLSLTESDLFQTK